MLVLLPFQGFLGSVGTLDDNTFEDLAHVLAEAIEVFLAQRGALGLLFGRQFALFGKTGQLVDSFNLFMFHGIFHPFGR